MAQYYYRNGICSASQPRLSAGDTITLDGVHPKIANPARRWWTPWRPRFVADTSTLAEFTVMKV